MMYYLYMCHQKICFLYGALLRTEVECPEGVGCGGYAHV